MSCKNFNKYFIKLISFHIRRFFAGFEPSSTSLTFALLELALNLDIQEKAREEILSVMKNHGGTITYEGLAEMNYLSRLYSGNILHLLLIF